MYIVQLVLSCIISEILRDWSKIAIFIFFIPPCEFDVPVREFPTKYCHTAWCGKTTMVWWKYFEDMCNRLDRIPACDRQKDGQTSCYSTVRALHTRRAVKNWIFYTVFLFPTCFAVPKVSASVRSAVLRFGYRLPSIVFATRLSSCCLKS